VNFFMPVRRDGALARATNVHTRSQQVVETKMVLQLEQTSPYRLRAESTIMKC